MRFIGILLAVLGGIAVARRAAASLLRLAHRGVDAFVAGEIEEVRARRGDLTGLQDAQQDVRHARGARQRAAAALCLWAGLLVVPPLTPWPIPMYAAYSLLWFLPAARGPRPAT